MDVMKSEGFTKGEMKTFSGKSNVGKSMMENSTIDRSIEDIFCIDSLRRSEIIEFGEQNEDKNIEVEGI